MPDQSDTQRRRSGFRTHLGYRTRAWREGYGEVELTVGPQHLNPLGIVHGGVYASLLDMAMGAAVCFCATPGNARYASTVSLTTTFLAGATSGTLVAVGRVDGVEGRIATVSGEVIDADGRLLVAGQGSFLYFPGSERLEGVPKRVRRPEGS
jgi:uncharacterized protein (TIGR00369 family)